MECAFARVLDDRSAIWATTDIAYVRDIVAHAEYGEALETLIAIAVSNGHGFGAGQLRRLEAIGEMMRLNVATLLETARAQYRHQPARQRDQDLGA